VVQAEWTSKRTSNTTSALFVKRNNNKSDNNKTRNHIFGPNPSACCDQHKAHGHSTNDCLWRKRLENKKADARVAVNTNPTAIPLQLPTLQATKAIIDYSSDARALNANTNFDTSTADPMFIVDAGASHHMVADKKLLTSLQSIPTKQIVIGDGSRLECKQQGDLQLGKLLLHGVLVLAWIVTLSRLAILHTPPSGSLTSTVRPCATTIMATIF